jgi:DNA-directed RNA polymerase subunit beta'
MAVVANKNIPLTGPKALMHALSKFNIDEEEARHREMISSGPKSKRNKSVQALNVIEGLRRNKITPDQLMIKNVPVIPPAFRPFTIAGDQFVPGDANELYRDLFHYRDLYSQSRDLFGETGSKEAALDLYDTAKALYGYGDSIAPKTKQRGVSGFLKQITGTSPKFSFFQRKMVSKNLDSVARGTIAIDPNLSLDQIGIPKNMAWKMYAPHVQRRLVHTGMKPGDALLHIRDQTSMAERALQREVDERPVIYSRAPSWHKFNVIAGRPQLVDGDTIMVNPLICAGMNADFDGDNMNLHVPAMPESVKEANDKLLPSKMLFSIRDYEQVMPKPSQEMILGLYTANRRPSKRSFRFGSQAEALAAIKKGDVDLSDDVQIG